VAQAVQEFLAAKKEATARGMELGVRALLNARAEKEFILEALRQIPPGEAAEVVAGFKDIVLARVDVLSSQASGVAILDAIRALIKTLPATLTPEQQEQIDAAKHQLDIGRNIEVELAIRDWPAILPHVKRKGLQRITKKKDSLELNIPEMPAQQLTETQKLIAQRIEAARQKLPPPLDVLKPYAYKGDKQAGFMYGGEGSKNIQPFNKTDAQRQKFLDAIKAEIGREGGWSAVNTYDDAVVTLGAGFTRSMLAKVMESFSASDPAAQDAFLDIGVTWSGGKALVVNTASGAVEEGDDALRLIQVDAKILSVFVRMAESAEHGGKLAAAQARAVLQSAADVPQSVVDSWKDLMSVRLVAHAIQWRSAKVWNAYAGTGGDVKAILKILLPAVGRIDKAKGGAMFVSSEQTGILFSFAVGKAKEALDSKTAGPLPKDIDQDETTYAGHVFFSAGGDKFFHMSP
jgi:hypothetical protein